MYSGEHAQRRGKGALRSVFSFVIMLAIFLGVFFGVRAFIVHPYEIPSGSMEKTIMTGDMLFSEKVTYYTRDPQRGDIVTFADPEIPSRVLIKRVIATEGQTVNLIDGKVYVDGVALDEPYTNGLPSYPLTSSYGKKITYPYTVPEGEMWVMGDNRTNSQDSRYYGSVKKSSVTGKAVLIYWPFDHFGFIN